MPFHMDSIADKVVLHSIYHLPSVIKFLINLQRSKSYWLNVFAKMQVSIFTSMLLVYGLGPSGCGTSSTEDL